jgi:hypothetical protein
MINLKRNNKLELVEAKGLRTRASSIYQPNQSEDFKISRSKFEDFLKCPRCFYLDRVKGLVSPGMPSWSLNETTDLLLKKEFDRCREEQMPHRLFIENGLERIVPFQHEEMNRWRDSMRHGLISRFEDTNIILSGGVDDIWFDTQTEELIVVDYKSQASSYPVEPESYLNSGWHQGYKHQMDFYNYLLNLMGFKTSDSSYFLVVNANRGAEGFNGAMEFSETIIPYKHETSWIKEKIYEMIGCMNSDQVPKNHPSCENCAYTKQIFNLVRNKQKETNNETL